LLLVVVVEEEEMLINKAASPGFVTEATGQTGQVEQAVVEVPTYLAVQMEHPGTQHMEMADLQDQQPIMVMVPGVQVHLVWS
jgi:hypothetical protein